jgi:murein DD-endopeptidase MepM/ murein hydrolase activator NlpD
MRLPQSRFSVRGGRSACGLGQQRAAETSQQYGRYCRMLAWLDSEQVLMNPPDRQASRNDYYPRAVAGRLVVGSVALVLLLSLTGPAALAETPRPPTPTPTPNPTPTAASSRATQSPSATSPASSSPSPNSSAQPSAASEASEEEKRAAAAARAAMAAVTLLERIDAMRAYATAELDFLRKRQAVVGEERAQLAARITQTEDAIAQRNLQLAQLLRAIYRATRETPLEAMLRGDSVIDGLVHASDLATLREEEQRVRDELARLQAELNDQNQRLQASAEELASLEKTIATKLSALDALGRRATSLVEAHRGNKELAKLEAEREIVRELAAEQERAHAAVDEIVARLAAESGVDLRPAGRWIWPVAGAVVTQEFGPSDFTLEPSRTVGGIRYAHFHSGIDLAAPLLSTVRAVADGRVAYAGYLPDGAMVVLIQHADGLISLYGHLDDGVRRPTVRAGQQVRAGDPIGAIGLTGLTTGPHIHFALMRGREPIDPREVLPEGVY